MSFYVENKQESNFKMVPAGSHLARCYRIIDLGSQKIEYMGETKIQRKVMLGWELFGEDTDGTPLKMDDGRPMGIFKNYTLSWAEMSTLRKDLQSWRGKPWTDAEARRFDLKSILGGYCMINVIHRDSNGKTYANVAAIAPVPSIIKSAGLPSPVNVNQLFTIAEPDMDLFETFSKNLQEKIFNAPEWKSKPATAIHSIADMDDDVPF